MFTSDSFSFRNLPVTLTSSEVWSFGASVYLLWVLIVPMVYGLNGATGILLWILLTWAVGVTTYHLRYLVRKYASTSGGLAAYTFALNPQQTWLARYAGVSQYLAWLGVFGWAGSSVVQVLEGVFESQSTFFTFEVVIVSLTVTAGLLGFSSTRILAILQSLFIRFNICILGFFSVGATVWLLQDSTPSLWPDIAAFLPITWTGSFFVAVIALLCLDIVPVLLPEANSKTNASYFLKTPVWFIPVFFGWGGYVYGRIVGLVPREGLQGMGAAFAQVFGSAGYSLAILFLLTSYFLLLNTAILIMPRILSQMSRSELIPRNFGYVNQRGVLPNAVLFTVAAMLLIALLPPDFEFYTVAGLNVGAVYLIFNWTLWRQRNKFLTLRGWPAGIICIATSFAFLTAGSIIGWFKMIGILSLPFALLGVLAFGRRFPFRNWFQRWGRPLFRFDFESGQILMTLVVVGLTVGILLGGLYFNTDLSGRFLWQYGLAGFVCAAFVAVAVMAWTIIPQTEALQETKFQLESLNRTLREDIEKRAKLERQLARSLRKDHLTKLGNRKLLETKLGEKIKACKHAYALIFIDLDRFKIVNDSLGHLIGDALLQVAARRIRNILKRRGTIARLGGDEFVVFLPTYSQPQEVEEIAQRIVTAFEKPLPVGKHTLTSTVSAGVVFGHKRYRRFEEVLRDADIAMYQSKWNGRNRYTVFTELMHAEAVHEHGMEKAVRVALQKKHFEIRYQPIINTVTCEIIGYETLLRMRGQAGELVSPENFLDIIEENGLIVPITWWILEKAAKDVKKWRTQGHARVYVSVNLSNRTLSRPDLLQKVSEVLTRHDLPADAFNLEVLESSVLNKIEIVQQNLRNLQQLGVQISIDDFGIGYSNLARLHELPANIIKVDQSYVRNLKGQGVSIIQTILELSKNMSFKVVIEGVEERWEKETLEKIGCTLMQGYFYARPMKAEVVPEYARTFETSANEEVFDRLSQLR